jgi:hypothetical protein
MISKLYITKKQGLILIFLLLFALSSAAQETLIPVSTLPVPDNNKTKTLKAGATLELPFFDDFSNSYSSPDQNRWDDYNVFINRSYAIDPPSIGVATFDAVDNTGQFYATASYGNSFIADVLTSKPINLNYPSDNTICLSFYFQPQGLGDNPEPQDSLMLDFYDPTTSIWTNVFRQAGSILTNFQQKIIHITAPKYLKDGFRFRFRNQASLSGGEDPSMAMNCDHWNLDYVYLSRGNDTITKDMAFYYPEKSILKNYESMPWKHFKADFANQLGSSVYAYIRNNNNIPKLIDSLYFVFSDNSGNVPNDTLTAGSHNIPPLYDTVFDPPFSPFKFLTNTTDSASFNIKAKFTTNTGDPKVNNEIIYVQKFYDYYAYDDGTAERGYGLTGDGAQNAQVACKFNCVKTDTLKAIQMYFNRSYKDKNQKYFYLTIWDDNDGVPGQIIYKRQEMKPEFENELNKFHKYPIDDAVLVISGVFYVGWIQTTSDMLNLGFDCNNNRKQNNFYNTSGEWVNSNKSGSMMIRPFFGKNLTLGINSDQKIESVNVKIYPNPAKDEIQIKIDNQSDYHQIKVSIFNLTGALVNQTDFTNNQPINLSGLVPGTYIIRLTDKTLKLNYSQKLIKLN